MALDVRRPSIRADRIGQAADGGNGEGGSEEGEEELHGPVIQTPSMHDLANCCSCLFIIKLINFVIVIRCSMYRFNNLLLFDGKNVGYLNS